MKDLDSLVARTLAEVASSADLAALDGVRVAVLGRKGSVTELLKGLGKLPAAERKAAGADINRAKARVTEAIEARRAELESASLERELASAAIDYHVTQVVDKTLGVHAKIAKKLFVNDKSTYWYRTARF